MAAKLNPDFWRGKFVLVTGHTGFKGAWAALMLKQMGAIVAGLSLPPETPSLFTQAELDKHLDYNFFIDIEDRDQVFEAISKIEPDIVIHFAAQSLVRRAYRTPRQTFGTNVMGVVHLLEALMDSPKLKTILSATTDKVYLNLDEGKPFAEGDPLGGIEPYGASKVGSEMVIAAFRASYMAGKNINMPVCRAGNVIGGGDWSQDRLVPDAIRAVMVGDALSVRNPKSSRPWQYVLDALMGYLLLIEYDYGRAYTSSNPEDYAWNFGPPVDQNFVTVEQICQWIEQLWPGKFTWEIERSDEPIKEAKSLGLDPAKAMNTLDWQPLHDPESAMQVSLEWYREFLDGGDTYELSCAHIERYLNAST